MTRLIKNITIKNNTIKNNTTLNSKRSRGIRFGFLTAVLVMVMGLAAVATQAQDPEVGSNGGWRAEKTVDDYMEVAKDGSAKSAAKEFDYAGNTLRTEVWVDKAQGEVYRKGQDLAVGFETNQDAYAVVYRIDTEGIVTVLWPRSRFDDGFIFGSHEYKLPVSGARKLRVSTNEGQGLIEAIVSQYPFDLRALELDFHHEHTADRYDFRVAGDPFLAMNEVNFAITGLEDSGEYVVTNYASYYVHQEVDHPRYLCSQCHEDDQVAYDPYRDDCTLDIEYDYSWYNGWYDNYGYYPVYGNPVYVYVDPWNHNPWVNYWYRPYYASAPWYGWGWGWGGCYSWNYSPYYRGDCVTVYSGGSTRYRPLDRTRINGTAVKTREYGRGSEMVRTNALNAGERRSMESRTRAADQRADRSTTVGRSGGRDVTYRGAKATTRTRSTYVQSGNSSRSQGGLRIRESGTSTRTGSRGTSSEASRRRHTAGGEGQRAGLVPVTRSNRSDDNWRGTTRVGGSSGTRGSGNSPTTVGNSRTNRSSSGSSSSGSSVQNSRSRNSGSSKTVQPRKRSTRVWNSTGSQSGSTRESSRSRSGSVENRRRSNSGSNSSTSNRSSGRSSTVKPRSNSNSSSGRNSSAVRKSNNSSSSSSRSSGTSRGSSSSSGSSRKSSGSSSSKSNGRSGSSRR